MKLVVLKQSNHVFLEDSTLSEIFAGLVSQRLYEAKISLLMPPKLKFTEGERVLCFHGPLIYEAKCIKGQVKEKTPRYLIHYNGWNKNWDEWVPESRVLKFNEANLMKQKELREQMYVICIVSLRSIYLVIFNCCFLINLLCHAAWQHKSLPRAWYISDG